MTPNKSKRGMLFICSPLIVLLLGIGLLLINNFGCNYEMTMQTRGVEYRGVCRWGHVSFIEEELATREKWRVNGWQLAVGNQLAYFITQRQRVEQGHADRSVLDNYNQIQSAFSVVNYAWLPLTEDKIVIFQRDPSHDVMIANREGWLDLYRWLFPPEPLISQEKK